MRITLLAGETYRARAYSQALSKFSIDSEVSAVIYGTNSKAQKEDIIVNDETISFLNKNNLFIPDLNRSVIDTFETNKWNYLTIENQDVNSSDIINTLNQLDSDIFVFAGYGGQLLKKEHFITGRRYLHMHPGDLPAEKGSTTIYYSILMRQGVTVSSFYMVEQIDSGDLINKSHYPIPKRNVNIDIWYDNCIRADAFIKTIGKIEKEGIKYSLELTGKHEDYFVIHPLLKHISILSLEK